MAKKSEEAVRFTCDFQLAELVLEVARHGVISLAQGDIDNVKVASAAVSDFKNLFVEQKKATE